jgi:MFS family permease
MTATRTRVHYGWIVLGAVFLIMLTASGLRAVLGVFIKPMEAEFGWDRSAMSQVAAISLLLVGAIGPFVGWLADRWGPRNVMALFLGVLAIGAMLSSRVTSLWQITITAGVIMAIGAGGMGMATASTIAARWFVARRGLVMGILGAGMSAGQLVVIPAAVWITTHHGWRHAFLWLGAAVFVTAIPLALAFVRDDPKLKGMAAYGGDKAEPRAGAAPVAAETRIAVSEAMTYPAFWLLAGTFFVCGYTSNGMVLTHLVPHAAEHGFSEMHAAQALGVMGAMNIVGTILSGWICDRFGRKGPLAFYYGVRGLSLIFLLYVWNVPSLHLFAAIFGLNYISTVPPTTTLTANIFGRFSVGVLSGWIFFAHQVGSALGAAAGGWIFDLTGSYSWAFISSAILAFIASGLSLAIKEENVSKTPSPAPSGVPVPAA